MNSMLKRVREWAAALLVAVLVLTLLPYAEGLAQKKKTTTKPETPAAEQQVTAPSKTPGTTLKDFLGKFKGSRTNLGVLMRLEADHFVVDDDGVVAAYPYAAIQYIKMLKVEEGEENPVLLDINLL
jgi:hypothetical protein